MDWEEINDHTAKLYHFQLMMAIFIIVSIPFLAAGCLGGVARLDSKDVVEINESDNQASMQRSADRLAAQRSRDDARQAIAEARYEAKENQDNQLTIQHTIGQQNTTERVIHTTQAYVHLQHLAFNRTLAFMGFMLVLVIIIGAVGVLLYMRYNPAPVANQYGVLPQYPTNPTLPGSQVIPDAERLLDIIQVAALVGRELAPNPIEKPPVPFNTFMTDPRFVEAGWEVVPNTDTLIRVNTNGLITQHSRLLGDNRES